MVEAFKFLFHMSEELGFRPYEQGLARLRLPANYGTEFGNPPRSNHQGFEKSGWIDLWSDRMRSPKVFGWGSAITGREQRWQTERAKEKDWRMTFVKK